MPRKMLHINFFDMSCTGSHMGVGQWADPNDNSRHKDRLEYYTWLAKLADKGKISCIFFADVYGVDDGYGGNAAAGFHGGSGIANLDPLALVSAMAVVSENVSFGVTASTSYINPFIMARTIGTLDHVTNGRFAWNIVTSYSKGSAQAMGKENITAHDKRYDEADEYMDMVYALWEGSWEDGAQLWSLEHGAYDYSKIHKVNFSGQYHNTKAYGPLHPSPQRTPVLFQAGTSKAGSAFAAKHAEAIFCGGNTPQAVTKTATPILAQAREFGREEDRLPKFFPQITPIIGRTVEEAQAKYDKALANTDYLGGLAKMSGYLGLDLSQFPLDEPFPLDSLVPGSGIQTMISVVQRFASGDNTPLTPRRMGQQMAFCGFAAMPCGTPEMVADCFEAFADEGSVDGFNVAYVSNPGSYEDFVELLVPILQERGIMQKEYTVPGGTFRENLLRQPGVTKMSDGHHSAKFRYAALKEQGLVDENGDIWINRKEPMKEEAKAEMSQT